VTVKDISFAVTVHISMQRAAIGLKAMNQDKKKKANAQTAVVEPSLEVKLENYATSIARPKQR
jgi:hypothetical protein